MIIHQEREREIEGEVVTALRAGDNFLISSPPRSATSFFTRSLSSSTQAKCPFVGTPDLPLMCPRGADILSSTSAENI